MTPKTRWLRSRRVVYGQGQCRGQFLLGSAAFNGGGASAETAPGIGNQPFFLLPRESTGGHPINDQRYPGNRLNRDRDRGAIDR